MSSVTVGMNYLETLTQQTLGKTSLICLLICILCAPTTTHAKTIFAKHRERVKVGTVIAINRSTQTLTIEASTTEYVGTYTDDTLFYHGDNTYAINEEITLGQVLYFFGTIPFSTSTDMRITKVVIKNPSKLLHKEKSAEKSIFDFGF